MARVHEPHETEAALRILDAADALLGEVGFEATSMQDVATRAGVTKALVFYHFKGKDRLFERVLDRYYSRHIAVLEASFGGEGGLVERLHRLVDAYLDFIEQNARYVRLVQAEAVGPGTHHALIRRHIGPMMQWFERALSALVPAEGPLAARHFYLTFSGAVTNYFTYVPMLGPLWAADPLTAEALRERRAHIHWLVDAMAAPLARDAAARPATSADDRPRA